MTGNAKQLGAAGEEAALRFLRGAGHAILARNYTSPMGELDLISRDGDVIVFVEVKTSSNRVHDDPENRITPAKQRTMRKVAEHWLRNHNHPNSAYRFDAVSVVVTPGVDPEVRHIIEAFIPRS